MQDVIRRGRITADAPSSPRSQRRRAPGAVGRTDLPPFEQIANSFRDRVRELGPTESSPLEPAAQLDYVRLVDEEHEHRRNRRRGGVD